MDVIYSICKVKSAILEIVLSRQSYVRLLSNLIVCFNKDRILVMNLSLLN